MLSSLKAKSKFSSGACAWRKNLAVDKPCFLTLTSLFCGDQRIGFSGNQNKGVRWLFERNKNHPNANLSLTKVESPARVAPATKLVSSSLKIAIISAAVFYLNRLLDTRQVQTWYNVQKPLFEVCSPWREVALGAFSGLPSHSLLSSLQQVFRLWYLWISLPQPFVFFFKGKKKC